MWVSKRVQNMAAILGLGAGGVHHPPLLPAAPKPPRVLKAVRIPIVMKPHGAICTCCDSKVTVWAGGQAYNGPRVEGQQLLYARCLHGSTTG